MGYSDGDDSDDFDCAHLNFSKLSLSTRIPVTIPISRLKALGLDAILVDTPTKFTQMISELNTDLKVTKILNLDFEGVDLCKTGKVCLGQFHAAKSKTVFVLDFIAIKSPFTLEDRALSKMLESDSIQKVFYDPRNDMDALAFQYSVTVNKCIDLQMCEVAYRRSVKKLPVKFVMGLQKTLENHLVLPYKLKNAVMEVKNKGKYIFSPEHGGSYTMFEKRPLNMELVDYAAVDVFYFDELREKLFNGLSESVKEKVEKVSTKRLVEYKTRGYDPKGRSKSEAPSF